MPDVYRLLNLTGSNCSQYSNRYEQSRSCVSAIDFRFHYWRWSIALGVRGNRSNFIILAYEEQNAAARHANVIFKCVWRLGNPLRRCSGANKNSQRGTYTNLRSSKTESSRKRRRGMLRAVERPFSDAVCCEVKDPAKRRASGQACLK